MISSEPPASDPRKPARGKPGFLRSGLAGLAALLSLGPLIWALGASLSSATAGTSGAFSNYRTILGPSFQFSRAIANSLLVSTAASGFAIALAALSAYAIARWRFRLRRLSLAVMVVAGLTPPVALIAPTFALVQSWGLQGSLVGMILPNIAYNIPMSLLLLVGAMRGLPVELEDAAMVDGLAPRQVFWRIALPACLPSLAATGALAFVSCWGEFMMASVISMGLPEKQTVPVAILGLSRAFELEWGWVAAGVTLASLPVALLVWLAAPWISRQVYAGAIKG